MAGARAPIPFSFGGDPPLLGASESVNEDRPSSSASVSTGFGDASVPFLKDLKTFKKSHLARERNHVFDNAGWTADDESTKCMSPDGSSCWKCRYQGDECVEDD
jgi:hypothetical protein